MALFSSPIPVPYKLRLHHGCVFKFCQSACFTLFNITLTVPFIIIFPFFFLIRDYGPFSRAINEEINISKEPKYLLFFDASVFQACKDALRYCQKRYLFVNTTARERHADNRRRSSCFSSSNSPAYLGNFFIFSEQLQLIVTLSCGFYKNT